MYHSHNSIYTILHLHTENSEFSFVYNTITSITFLKPYLFEHSLYTYFIMRHSPHTHNIWIKVTGWNFFYEFEILNVYTAPLYSSTQNQQN